MIFNPKEEAPTSEAFLQWYASLTHYKLKLVYIAPKSC
jgi:hypothetical protein